MSYTKKYNHMEPVLQYVNRRCINYSKNNAKRNRAIIKIIVKRVIQSLQNRNRLFAELFTEEFYAGSYFDGMKVGEPDEFDVYLPLELPCYLRPILERSCKSGYVCVKCPGAHIIDNEPKNSSIDQFVDECGYLIPSLLYSWIYGEISKYIDNKQKKIICYKKFKVFVDLEKHGPAVTLKLQCLHPNLGQFDISLDLVPCFEINISDCRKNFSFKNPLPSELNLEDETIFIVPKEPKDALPYNNWRLSFYAQEKLIMNDHNYMKPVIKLLKLLRDHLDIKFLNSYIIKNVFLWQCINDQHANWKGSLSHYFMFSLKVLQKHMEDGSVLYFWMEDENLVPKRRYKHCYNMSQYIKHMINNIEKSGNPFTFARYMVDKDQFLDICNKVHVNSRLLKNMI